MKKLFSLLCCLGSGLALMAQSKDTTLFNVQELVISADRFEEKVKDLPRQVDVINRKKIISLNQQNAADLLQQTGNVFVQKSQQGGGSPVLRGFEANKVLLVIDGVRLNNAIYRGGHLQNVLRIDQENLQKAEVLYGAGSLIYGSDALGGVVHFVTREPIANKRIGGTVNFRYSNANHEYTEAIGLSGTYQKLGYYFNYSQSSFDDLRMGANRSTDMGTLGLRNYYQGRTGDSDRVIKNDNPNIQVGTAYKQQNLMGKLVFKPQPWQTHKLSYIYSRTGDVPRYDRLSEFNGATPVFGDWYYGPEILHLISYSFEDLKTRQVADQIRITTAFQEVKESRNSRSFGSTLLTKREEEVKVASLNVDLRKRIGIHELKYGIEASFNHVNSVAGKYSAGSNFTSKTAPASTRYPDGGSNMWWTAAYLTLNQELNENWIITEGLRANYTQLHASFTDKSFYSFLPDETQTNTPSICGNVGVVFLPNNNLKFYANTGNAFRTPNVDDMNKLFDSKSGSVMIIPNSKLKAEQSWTSEIGMNVLLHHRVELSFNAYYTLLSNAIVVAPTTVNGADSLLYDGKMTAVSAPQNMQSGYIYGYSLNVKAKITRDIRFEGSLNYTYGRIKGDSLMPLDHIPPLFGRAALNYERNRIKASVYSLYAAAKKLENYYLNGEDNLQYATPTGMPAWYTVNLMAGYQINRHFTLNLGVENVLDRNYRTFSSGMSAAGRNVWANLRFVF